MGIARIERNLYVGFWAGSSGGSEVARIPTSGGAPTPFLTGFGSPVIAVGAKGRTLYVGDASGAIWQARA